VHKLFSKPIKKKREKSAKSWGFHSVVAEVSTIFYDKTPRHCNQFKIFRMYIVPSPSRVLEVSEESFTHTSRTSRSFMIRLICSLETTETNHPVTWRHFPGTSSFEICGSSCSEVRLRW
jgi:hypothetical protein